MTVAALITIAAFTALWSLPGLLGRTRPTRAVVHSRAGWLLALYGAMFVASAWWWSVPLAVQKSVRQFASSSDPAAAGIGCSEVTSAASKFESASKGDLDFRQDGSALLDGATWTAMNAEQREAFAMFAAKVAECSGAAISDRVTIKDIVTGADLNTH